MSTIAEYFQQSELALAAYANLMVGVPDKAELIDKGMSDLQAIHFAANYSVVAQYSDATGLSATVFADAAGNKYLAIRGTQGATDYLADYLILRGIPSQLNPQYLSLKTKVLEWMNDPNMLKGATFTVSGHSLGGYLAAGLVADFSTSISHAYLYNAPGNNSLVYQVMQALGIAATPDAAKITSLRADAGISPIAGLGNDFSPPISIAIENQFLAANPPAALNHSQQILTDALAVYNLFVTLDPTLNTATNGIQTITNILKASSNIAANTLESAVSALGKLFLVNGAAGFNGNEFDSGVTGRDLLYTALKDINTAVSGSYTLRDLSAFNAAQIASVAQGNLAYRYALHELNPFALLGNDTVYAQHNIQGELDIYDPATRSGTLSQEWLTDRAAMLGILMARNTADAATATTDVLYTDASSGITLRSGSLAADNLLKQIRFGSDVATTPETISGGLQNDHLYGMGGEDTINGDYGNDYLEGGQGDDLLYGGFNNDTLVGGQGNDTYRYFTGEGNDTILDSDGLGKIYIGTDLLDGGESKDGGRTWQSADGQHTYALISGDINAAEGATLIVDGSLTIQHYHAGNLNLTLNGAAPIPPIQPTLAITGDIVPTDASGSTGIQAAGDANGNPIGSAGAYEDILRGSAGDDHILSGELDDNVGGRAGNDWIEGGTGSDYIVGGSGLDLIEGGVGADILAGDAGNDQLYGDTKITTTTAILDGNTDTATNLKGDWLSGGSGDDILVAGADNDVLAGGGGNDLIIAGAGDDHILGDADYTAQYLIEATPRYSVDGVSQYHTSAEPFNWTVTPQAGGVVFAPVIGTHFPADSGADTIHAGDGADRIWAGAGGDAVYGESGNDRIMGGDGNDALMGGAGDDTLWGDNGNGGTGDDYLDGGAGDDTLSSAGGSSYLDSGINERINALANEDTLFVIRRKLSNETSDATGVVLFVREASRFKAANDCDYQAFLERSAA